MLLAAGAIPGLGGGGGREGRGGEGRGGEGRGRDAEMVEETNSEWKTNTSTCTCICFSACPKIANKLYKVGTGEEPIALVCTILF